MAFFDKLAKSIKMGAEVVGPAIGTAFEEDRLRRSREKEEIAREERAEERYGRQSDKQGLRDSIRNAIQKNDLIALQGHIETARSRGWENLVKLGENNLETVRKREGKIETATEEADTLRGYNLAAAKRSNDAAIAAMDLATSLGYGSLEEFERQREIYDKKQTLTNSLLSNPGPGTLAVLATMHRDGANMNPNVPEVDRVRMANERYDSNVGTLNQVSTPEMKEARSRERQSYTVLIAGMGRDWNMAATQNDDAKRAIRRGVIERAEKYFAEVDGKTGMEGVTRMLADALTKYTEERIDDIVDVRDAIPPKREWRVSLYPHYFTDTTTGRMYIPNWDEFDNTQVAFNETEMLSKYKEEGLTAGTIDSLNEAAAAFQKDYRIPYLETQKTPAGLPSLTGLSLEVGDPPTSTSAGSIQQGMLRDLGDMKNVTEVNVRDYLLRSDTSNSQSEEVLANLNFSPEPIRQDLSGQPEPVSAERYWDRMAATGGPQPSMPRYDSNKTVAAAQRQAGIEFEEEPEWTSGGMEALSGELRERRESDPTASARRAHAQGLQQSEKVINNNTGNAHFMTMAAKALKGAPPARQTKAHLAEMKKVYMSYQRALSATPVDAGKFGAIRKKADSLEWTEMKELIDSVLNNLGQQETVKLDFLPAL